MGTAISKYDLNNDVDVAFRVISNEADILSAMIVEKECNDNICQTVAQQKYMELINGFSEKCLSGVCEKMGIPSENKTQMSSQIVAFHMKKVEMLQHMKKIQDCKTVEELDMLVVNFAPKPKRCEEKLKIKVDIKNPSPLVYSPQVQSEPLVYSPQVQSEPLVYSPQTFSESKTVLPTTHVHMIQGEPVKREKTIRVVGEDVQKIGGNVVVTNPQLLERTHYVSKNQLNDFSKSLGPNTKIKKIETVPKTQKIPRGTPVRAIADHVPKTPGEIGLKEGQATSYLEPAPLNWAYVKHSTGEEGYVPATHLTL